MNTKAFAAKFDVLGEGKLTGYASVFDVLDEQGDIVRRGAFLRDLKERGDIRPILADHDVTRSIGVGKFREDTHGLRVDIELAMELADARDTFIRISKGIVKSFSIGYSTVTERMTRAGRELLDVTLFETSCVLIPACADAVIDGAKAHNDLQVLLTMIRSARTEMVERKNVNELQAALAAIKGVRL